MLRSTWKSLVVLVVAATMLGCGKGDKNPSTVKVSGTITYNGNAVEGAVVQFNPMDKEAGKPAVGMTDAQGKYELTTFVSGDGAVPGSYGVGVKKAGAQTTAASGGAPVGSAENPDAAYKAAEEGGENPLGVGIEPGGPAEKASKDELPSKYAVPDSSGLIANVSASNTKFDFDLKD